MLLRYLKLALPGGGGCLPSPYTQATEELTVGTSCKLADGTSNHVDDTTGSTLCSWYVLPPAERRGRTHTVYGGGMRNWDHFPAQLGLFLETEV